MINAVRKLEQLLRGEATTLRNLEGDRFDLPVIGLSLVLTVLGMAYGACMGLFAVTNAGRDHAMQVLASTVKTPALFVLTLFVTFPSLYVFNAMFGSRLRLMPMLRLMVGALAVTLAVLSSIGPIVGFFGVSSTSYAFMVLLNVVVFAVAGVLGLGFLLQTLHRMNLARQVADFDATVARHATTEDDADAVPSTDEFAASVSPPLPPPLVRPDARPTAGSVWGVFRVWVFVFGAVGAQMAWVLRPFIGDPHQPFAWFRPVGGNFYQSVITQAGRLFGW